MCDCGQIEAFAHVRHVPTDDALRYRWPTASCLLGPKPTSRAPIGRLRPVSGSLLCSAGERQSNVKLNGNVSSTHMIVGKFFEYKLVLLTTGLMGTVSGKPSLNRDVLQLDSWLVSRMTLFLDRRSMSLRVMQCQRY
ncbi:unnamed protein product [Protopolystoma xenopodis]|uniref:Uncharacterized protein n=1 Tax=Protopolystoma xenopodis TaxID=117903 RepID=A0A3S5FEZ7_9PLAT|nr:unnamed protein product [Protopolystoma xenopodis]